MHCSICKKNSFLRKDGNWIGFSRKEYNNDHGYKIWRGSLFICHDCLKRIGGIEELNHGNDVYELITTDLSHSERNKRT